MVVLKAIHGIVFGMQDIEVFKRGGGNDRSDMCDNGYSMMGLTAPLFSEVSGKCGLGLR